MDEPTSDDSRRAVPVPTGASEAERIRDAQHVARRSAGAAALILRSVEPARRDEPVTTRNLFTPRWICFHVITWVLAAVMAGLGWWQLGVSDHKGFDLQNFSYWIQWWLFALFAIFFWARSIRLARRPPADSRSDGIVLTSEEVARSSGGTDVAVAGPGSTTQPSGRAELVSPSSTPDNPMVYRGHVIPMSGERPVRSHSDSYHDSYNDYLWQISLADGDES